MIKCLELNREFANKRDMISELVKNKSDIISLKKAHIHKSREKGQAIDLCHYDVKSNSAKKGIEEFDAGYIYPVISNTGYMDFHNDVHLAGSMNKTANEQQGKVHYIVNHSLEIGKVIAYPKDVEMMIKTLSWTELGKSYSGTTEALIFKTRIQDYSNDDAAKVVRKRLPAQNSIRMQYLRVELGVKEENEEWAKENEIWSKYANQIANKERADEVGYAWFVEELKIIQEGSMVLLGSNDSTPIFIPGEPLKQHSQKNEPSDDTQKEKERKLEFIKNLAKLS